MNKLLNYLGQMRLYSAIDFILMVSILSGSFWVLLSAACLWFSFLIFLESTHHDPLREVVSYWIWVPFAIIPFLFLNSLSVIFFIIAMIFYSQKIKNLYFSLTAPFWRCTQTLAILLPFDLHFAIVAGFLVLLRNVIGDFRSGKTDSKSKVKTIPVYLGYKKNYSFAFYLHFALVILTTLVWITVSKINFSLTAIIIIVVLEIIFYPLTPRVSNPKFIKNLFHQK